MDTEPIAAVLLRHLDDFRRPGVLSVRPGFHLDNGWLTDRPAIVVTVEDLAAHPYRSLLPATLEGFPVDIRQASPLKRQRLLRPTEYLRSLPVGPDDLAVPEFPEEYTLAGPVGPEAELPFEAAKPPKPNLPYTPPDGVALAPVQGTATVRLSASPDSGWPTLDDFLAATETSLTVGLYDFTSAHVLKSFEESLAGKAVKLVLDHPAKNPTADQTDEQTVDSLEAALGADLTQAWALDRMDPIASAWVFPTAYHIKVAVRDATAFWLSSGNWNNSNQPDIDPVNVPADATEARSRDRDWHVVVEDRQLAATFESYLLHDLSVAGAHNQHADVPPGDDLRIPVLQSPPFQTFYPARTVTADMRIVPVLTPDAGVYVDAVTALIGEARTSLYLQFQYIKLPKVTDATSQAFVDLVDAVIDRQKTGVDLRIIMSQYETVGYLEQLQAAGLDVVNAVKVQNNVHNKGIVVDGASVLVSSQNWSTDGVLYNRDAGVIITNAEVAAYFQTIFLHDWDHLAARKALPD